MQDRELLELAAKAAGRDVLWKRGMHRGEPHEGLYDNKTGHVTSWNPLTDDGDALRLVVNLGLIVRCYEESIIVDGGGISTEEHDLSCRHAATRRAIVRAAAEIGKKSRFSNISAT